MPSCSSKLTTYLGHSISAEGQKPSEDKVKVISQAPAPTQLHSFLGILDYYGKFLKGLSSMLAPLNVLLQKNAKWKLHQDQKDAFTIVKQELTSPEFLIHYDPQRKLLLSCDASPYGIGAVISHVMDDGSEQPIAFTSRSALSMAERKYTEIEKRADHYLWSKEISPTSLWNGNSQLFQITVHYNICSMNPEQSLQWLQPGYKGGLWHIVCI